MGWRTGFWRRFAYPRVKEIAEQTISSGLIYLNSHAIDFKTPELRPYLEKYLRGSNGYDALERVKLLKILWDAVGTEFGGRHELYERNYAGNYENIRLEEPADRDRAGRRGPAAKISSTASWPSTTSTAGLRRT